MRENVPSNLLPEALLQAVPRYEAVNSYVKEYMSRYDPSHDYSHIQRVVRMAVHILDKEPQSNFDPHHPVGTVVVLAALLHDVGDKKYLRPGESAEQMIEDALARADVPKIYWRPIQTIVPNVSYSNEIKNPDAVKQLVERFPELAIVQDADRLDAIGAIGIARTFAFGGAKAPERGLQGCMDHFGDKLEKLQGMMKTEIGKQLAAERTRRLDQFRDWWEEENKLKMLTPAF